jgi:hypothetical protein
MVEQEGNGVAEDLPQQPASQVPEVLGPHPLYAIALCELREDGVDAVTKAAQIGTPLRMRIVLFGPVRCEELDTRTPGQLFGDLGRVVVAVSNGEPTGGLEKSRQHGKLVGISRSYRKAADESWPAHPHMHPEAVEGLPEESVLTESGFSPEARAAVGTSEQASRQGQGVADGKRRVVRSESEKLLPEALLDLPEVGGLPSEGGAVDLVEGREPLCVVPPEEEVDALVGVYAEELAYDLDGENFRVGELGLGSTASDAPPFELIIHEAEDRDDKGAKIHERKTSFCSRWIGAPPRVRRSSVWLKCSKKPAHGVN